MRTNGGDARMCEVADICTTFAIIYYNILYHGIINGSLDVRDNEDLVTHSLVFLGISHAREIDIVVACQLRLVELQYLHGDQLAWQIGKHDSALEDSRLKIDTGSCRLSTESTDSIQSQELTA